MKKVIISRLSCEQRANKADKKREALTVHRIPKCFKVHAELAVYTDGGYKEADLDDDRDEVAG